MGLGSRVSIHAPARGATCATRPGRSGSMFQFTRPRGARHGRAGRCQRRLPSFNSRAREGRDHLGKRQERGQASFNSRAREGRDWCAVFVKTSLQFQFTRPRGARPSAVFIAVSRRCGFNSRAREGRDLLPWQLRIRRSVSIHAPARGATPSPLELKRIESLNSRAPEGRDAPPAARPDSDCFNSRAREARHLSEQTTQGVRSFNSRAREGRDAPPATGWSGSSSFNSRAREGRDAPPDATKDSFLKVSIHAPARGATKTRRPSWASSRFQFTRPRGARPM